MARLFPNRLCARVPHEVALAFRKLKKLPDDFSIHHSLPEVRDPSESPPPDFLVFWRERFGFLIKIASTSQQLAESALQGSLFAKDETTTLEEFGLEEQEILLSFSRKLDPHIPLQRLILFPNVSRNTIDTISVHRTSTSDVSFLGLDQLGPEAFPKFLTGLAAAALSDPQILTLRHRFSPEISVPETFSAVRTIDRKTAATLTPALLDLDQEWCLKNQLYLPLVNQQAPEASGQSAPLHTRLVTGVAGSGKSLILLYRAALLSRIIPQRRTLLLTHNKPILNELKRRLAQLTPKANRIQSLTFFQWSARHLPSWPERTINARETLRILKELGPAPFQTSFLAEEIGRIKDHGLTKKSQYLATDRTGWGTPLPSSHRESLWSHFRRYQQHLDSHQLIDWHGIAMRFHQAVISKKITLQPYDAILIDEAQFFAKAWFDIVRQALKPGGQLFLAADPTQGFLKRRQSWLASGIDVRGRTSRLHRAYRNTRHILNFAARFFAARQHENPAINPESFNLPTQDQLLEIPFPGTRPEIIHCPTLQDSHLRAANEIKTLHRNHLPAGHLFILHADSSKLASFETTLATVLGDPALVHDAKTGVIPEKAFCQTSTLNAATGLEAPIVFLLGIDSLLDREHDPRLTPDERAELHASQTSLLYMAFTRAGQKLVIFSTSPERIDFFKSL